MHTRGRAVAVGLLVAGAAAAALLHWWAEFSFPLAWVDEAHFLAPARSLITRGTLAAPQIGAAQGIFWLPDGYSVLVAPLAGSVTAVRALSLVAAVAFATGLVLAVDRAGVVWVAAAAAAWLVAPRVVLMSNVARMEAPVLALAGVALLFIGGRRWVAALAVAALAPLVHPVGVVVLAAVAACAAWFRHGHRGRWDWFLLGGVGVAWAAEAAWFAWHADLVSQHLAFQLQRKAGRPPSLPWTRALLLALAVGGGLEAARRRREASAGAPVAATCLLMAAGFVVVTAVGNELWYEVLGGATAGLLLAAGAVLLLPLGRLRTGGAALAGVAGGALAAAGIVATLTTPLYGMNPGIGRTGEWQRFTAEAVVALDRLDRQLDAPATVVVHRLSGIGPWLYDRQWRHLRVVQPTPVTPVPAAGTDYALATLDQRPFTRAVVEAELPAGEPVAALRSDQGSFELRVYRGAFRGP
ncbi:MAG: hypothetical protein M3387_14195 [Actinomycetota bacterium]|nr:hypothetical protein [Actinomycetota bacterium]